VRVLGSADPSLISGTTINQTTFARDKAGDAVTVMEVGADTGDINTLAAGVLAADGYSIHFGVSIGVEKCRVIGVQKCRWFGVVDRRSIMLVDERRKMWVME